jgi:carbonic anhydrase/acetyltransferase-like protein (isoleucine patch superfamily)
VPFEVFTMATCLPASDGLALTAIPMRSVAFATVDVTPRAIGLTAPVGDGATVVGEAVPVAVEVGVGVGVGSLVVGATVVGESVLVGVGLSDVVEGESVAVGLTCDAESLGEAAPEVGLAVGLVSLPEEQAVRATAARAKDPAIRTGRRNFIKVIPRR